MVEIDIIIGVDIENFNIEVDIEKNNKFHMTAYRLLRVLHSLLCSFLLHMWLVVQCFHLYVFITIDNVNGDVDTITCHFQRRTHFQEHFISNFSTLNNILLHHPLHCILFHIPRSNCKTGLIESRIEEPVLIYGSDSTLD